MSKAQRTLHHRAFGTAVALFLAAATASQPAIAEDQQQSQFDSPEEAITALIAAVEAEGTDAIIDVLGPSGAELADSGDPVADADRRSKFVAAYKEAHEISKEGTSKAILVIGSEQFPVPIPMVSENGKWRWDTEEGLDEILTRRIGENELSTIQVMRAFVDAQEEYSEVDRDGKGAQYARRLLSQEGKKDGLYWPASNDDDISPLGPLVAEARSEGYQRAEGDEGPRAYHGYLYRMLSGQGPNAEGGAREFIVNDRMIAGYALIAIPAEYENSGVLTFIVNQEGEVYEKDLGPETAEAAAKIELFDPDSSWSIVEDEDEEEE